MLKIDLICTFLTYLLTPCSRVLREKLTSSQPDKKSPHFMEAEGSLTHLQVRVTCPYPEPFQSSPCLQSPFLKIHLPIYAWVLQVVPFPQVSSPKPLYTTLLPRTCYIPLPSHYSRFYHPNNIGWGVQIISSSLFSFIHSPLTSSLLSPDILLSNLFSNTLSLRSFFNMSDQVSHPYKKQVKF